ncbi:MAG: DUF885 domain-containing protein [Chloroflexi bacterium]|nr:DUF885 domain-containing protein [Chloroflexota bacterium]
MTAAETVRRLADDFWETILRRNPTIATFYGDERYNDRLPDVSPEARAVEVVELDTLLSNLRAVPAEELDADDRVTWDMLRLAAQSGLEAIRLRLDEMGVDQMDGPQVWLPALLNWHPTDTPEHVAQLVARFRAFPTYMDQYLANLRDGIRDRRTAPRIAVERVVAQLEALLATKPADSLFAAAARSGSLKPVQKQALLAAIEHAVYPAYRRMLDLLTPDYLDEHARKDPGVWSVADGAEIYAMLVRHHTTTDFTPEQLHQVGLDELEGIHAEMRAIMARLGDDSGDVRAFMHQLVARADNLPASREEIVHEAERHLSLAQAALPRAFGRLPSTPCIVKPIEDFREKDSPPAFYYQPSQDGGRPGIFYVNTYQPETRPRHTVPALVFHEGVPGHHLQIALAQEKPDLPAFRRLGSGMSSNAYVEGWALYTERLADEMGLYPDDLARFGMLGYQAWRACRLVVDTGLHALRWTRQQAVDFFLDNVGLTELETLNEVDRYIIWPGQALSYKTGQREIEALRRETQTALGERFDLSDFHDEVLRHGPVPLSTLRQAVTDWRRRYEFQV